MTETTATTTNPLEAFEKVSPTPYYTCTGQGVFYHSMDTDKHGNIQEKPPLRLSDSIRLIGRGTDHAGNHYRLIQWRDRLTRQPGVTALSMEDIGSNWGKLQRLGITIHANRRKRELLADYLQSEGDHTAYTITDRAGWQNAAYILPNGEIIAPDSNPPRIHYNGDTSQNSAYQPKGRLKQWQHEIARYAQGNSRLSLALGCAFAAPLMRFLDVEGGGFHLYGDSSDGKTTAARVALSVWGNPDTLKLTWEGTGHGFSNIAAARNDGLLILDEIGQAAPRVVAQTAYAVINGTSKIQGAREGGNREVKQWRVFVLSTGEKTLQNYSQSGGADWQAGQANRLPSIPANAGKGLGIFDTLHGHENGAEQAEHLNHAASQYHGMAGRAYLQAIQKDPQAAYTQANAILQTFTASLPSLSGQARRVGTRFALIAAALELAHQWGIIHQPAACLAIKQCFDDWYSLNGSGNYEDRRIIETATGWMQRYANSPRMAFWESKNTDRDHAGYQRYSTTELKSRHPCASTDELDAVQEYWLIPAVFEEEICQSYEPGKVCAVLYGVDWLQPTLSGGKTRYKRQRSGGGRFYVLQGITPPDDLENNEGDPQ